MIDWGFFKKNIKFNAALAKSIDRGLLPYSLSTQSDALLKASTDLGFKAADIDATTKTAYLASVRSLTSAARRYDARRAAVKAAKVASTNTALLAIEKSLNSNLTALDVWDDTIYPFQQSMTDLEAMQAAVDALEKTPVAYRDAVQRARRRQLRLVRRSTSATRCTTRTCCSVSRATCTPTWPTSAGWRCSSTSSRRGTRCAPRGPTKTVPTAAIASLKAKIAAEQADIKIRLETLTGVLNGVTGQIKAITPKTR